MLDLHTHSTFSDGSDTPTQLAEKAHHLGISAIALTDHDTTLSYDEMSTACSKLGLELVTGVEVSLRDTEFPRVRDGVTKARNVHVLAYFLPLDAEHPIQKKLTSLRRDRDSRNHELVTLLQEKGFEDLTLAYLTEMTGNVDSIGRPHFARAMIDLHPELVGEQNENTWNRIFTDWLGTEPFNEDAIPGVVVLLTEQFGVEVDHGPGEVRTADGIHVAGHFGQVGEGEVLKSLLLEQRHQLVVSTVAVVAQRSQLLLEGVFGVQGQEVGQHVDVARFGDAVAHPGELGVAQRDLHAGHRFESEPRARRRHFVVTQRRVVVGQRDRRYTQIVCLFGQLRGRVRSVGERGVSVKI